LIFWVYIFPIINTSEHLKQTYYFVTYALAGGIGGFIFLNMRIKSIKLEASLGDNVYTKEAILRMSYSVISGFMMYLAIKAKLILGGTDVEHGENHYLILLLCIICGASEKLLPGIIKKMEENT